MNYSHKIDQLNTFIESLGFSVDLYSSDLPDNIAGRTCYMTYRVMINCPTAMEAFYTLLHEAGHALSYDKYFRKLNQSQPDVETREIYAYLYGWVINKQLNLGVSKSEWRHEELERKNVND